MGNTLEVNGGDHGGTAELVRVLRDFPQSELVTVAKGGRSTDLLILANGSGAVSVRDFIEQGAATPDRRRGEIFVNRLQDFVPTVLQWVDRERTIVAVRFGRTIAAGQAGVAITAVLNYHPRGDGVDDTRAGWGDFLIHAVVPYDPRFLRWYAQANPDDDDNWMDMRTFAEFVDDSLNDLAQPDQLVINMGAQTGYRPGSPADVLAVSRGLQVNGRKDVKQAVSLTNGDTEVQFNAVNEPTVTVPPLFAISIPIWEYHERVTLPVRLRYRADHSVIWQVKLWGLQDILTREWTALADQLGALLSPVPVVIGNAPDGPKPDYGLKSRAYRQG